MGLVSRVVLGKLNDVAMVARAAAAERELSPMDPIEESQIGEAQQGLSLVVV
ncbi:hypothetical protein A2U01_0102833, partial [Trifolium medium]|nr:hypothetical protein [Trifolium medium]